MENENKYIYALVALLLVGVIASYYILTGPSRKAKQEEATQDELEITDTRLGEGAEAVSGATLKVYYTGMLEDGTVFDSNADSGEPFEFVLGQGQVIQGWEQGFEGMKVGGIRKLTIPPHLGYGDVDMGDIPANSTLIFEVELVEVVSAE